MNKYDTVISHGMMAMVQLGATMKVGQAWNQVDGDIWVVELILENGDILAAYHADKSTAMGIAMKKIVVRLNQAYAY